MDKKRKARFYFYINTYKKTYVATTPDFFFGWNILPSPLPHTCSLTFKLNNTVLKILCIIFPSYFKNLLKWYYFLIRNPFHLYFFMPPSPPHKTKQTKPKKKVPPWR